ncbi:MAG: HU family DNA-binding protein [Massilibacteroides sp.]|nr:HU family DNA-binding protein [Massilibacteroides sp.]MDD3061695.1 HU family DNA-binding protein [Massilibacteroides sp.]MDD4114387.1 HU family DNA-binding protein [Massilibacteroides sp.]MDD4660260.1 HU family DNA-binding protein [Massilibacteroides sp.]
MNNKELVVKLSDRLDFSVQETTDLLSALSDVMGAKLVDNDSLYIQSFGLFEVKKRAERVSVNPVNGKRYLVPPKLIPVFKPGTTLKNRLKDLDVEVE